MKAYYNGAYLDDEKILISTNDRAFLYGDGFFETMLGFAGNVKLLKYHLERISEAMSFLWIEVPDELFIDNCSGIIADLFRKNKITGFAKIKIQVWRTEGGTYLPHNNSCNILIKVTEINKPVIDYKQSVSFSKKIKNQWTDVSKFKTCSALKYVLAGTEMKINQLDEIIITDVGGNISECLVSNIFWVKDNTVYTPSLLTGCIEGVSRTFILEELEKRSIPFEEVKAQQSELLLADSIFCTNAMGITHILKLGGKMFRIYGAIEDIFMLY